MQSRPPACGTGTQVLPTAHISRNLEWKMELGLIPRYSDIRREYCEHFLLTKPNAYSTKCFQTQVLVQMMG